MVCCGGDGTLHYTVNDVMNAPRPLPVGYLPFGSTNDFAASAGLRRPLEENCAAIGAMAPRPLDLGRFNERHFCYVAAFGMFTAVSYQTPQATKNLLGHFAYVLEGVLRLDLSQGWRATIQVDDRTLEGEFWYCSVSNSRYIGGMAVPEQNAVQLDDGLFEVMILRKPQTLPQARRLVTCLMSQKPDGELLYLLQARRVRAVFDEPTGLDAGRRSQPPGARGGHPGGARPAGAAGIKIQKKQGKPVAFPLFWPQMGQAGRNVGKKGEKFTRIGVFFTDCLRPGGK